MHMMIQSMMHQIHWQIDGAPVRGGASEKISEF
jgi:hypothetical protein